MENFYTGNTTWLGSAQNGYEFDPHGPGQTQYAITNGLGLIPTDRAATSQSGGTYIGGMAPVLPQLTSEQSNSMWGSMLGDQWNSGASSTPYEPQPFQYNAYQSWLRGGMQGENPMASQYAAAGITPGGSAPQLPGGGYVDVYPSGSSGSSSGGFRPGPGGRRGMPAPGGGGGGGMPGFSGINPHLLGMAGDITNRTGEMLSQQLGGIQSQASGVGGIGGSRQGVAEGLAIGKGADYLSGQLSNLFGQDWSQYQNRELSRYQADQGYDLGMGNLALGNRNADLNAAIAGSNLFNMGNQGWLSQGQGLQGIGNTIQQAPWQLIGNMTDNLSPYTGYGATTTQRNNTGSMGLMGSMLGGAQLGNLMFPNTNSNTGGMAITNGGGFSNMPNYMIVR
jgi:hypothetical protein